LIGCALEQSRVDVYDRGHDGAHDERPASVDADAGCQRCAGPPFSMAIWRSGKCVTGYRQVARSFVKVSTIGVLPGLRRRRTSGAIAAT
jgi:hypothetical protein